MRRAAAAIVDDLLATGPCDFVPNVAARLPLKIICDMMGIPDDQYDMVLANTNIILSGADPEFLSEDADQAVLQLLGAGQALTDLLTSLAAARSQAPAEDLVSALATANIDGEQLTGAELASFFILLADPERFDITRSPNPHVGFGGAGPHYCLGAHLARRELTVMLSELLTRVPGITAGEPDRLLSSFINGIKHLPCQF